MCNVMMKKSLSKSLEYPNEEICVDNRGVVLIYSPNVNKKVDVNRYSHRLSNNQVVVATRLEDSQNMLDRLLCCLKKIWSTIVLNCSTVNVMFAVINHGGNKMVNRKIDFDPEMDKIIDSIVKLGESRTSVVKRALSYVYRDSNFYNLE